VGDVSSSFSTGLSIILWSCLSNREGQSGGHVIPGCSVMTHRIPIKLQLPGKSRLIYSSISSSLHPGYHEILEPNIHTSYESNKGYRILIPINKCSAFFKEFSLGGKTGKKAERKI
jgi:hypothetical protein